VDAALYLTAREEGHLLGTVRSDRTRGLALLKDEQVLGAGFHGPGAEHPQDGDLLSVIRIHVVRRQVGLTWRRGAAAPDVRSLQHRRLASRPPTAGVRHHLDQAMASRGVDSTEVHRHALIMGSHREVVRAVVGGHADVGVTTRAWAAFSGLDFTTLVEEDYDVVFPTSALADSRVLAFARTLGSARFREAVQDLPGYDTGRSGTLAEAAL
jgi:molybdate-binding protein